MNSRTLVTLQEGDLVGEVLFDTKLIKIKTSVKLGEKIFKDAIKLLGGVCPKKTCEWCEKV